MRLKDVSRFFDKTTARDAYGSATFKCQVEPLDLYRMDGARIHVRGMSTEPGVIIPPRRAVRIGGRIYLVSDESQDHWEGEALRSRFVIQGASHLVEIRSISQTLAGESGVKAYAAVEFSKYSTDERDSSDFHPQYHVFFGKESVPSGSILQFEGRTLLVRLSRVTLSGLLDALCNELEDPVADVSIISQRAYNPITDSYTESSVSVRCIQVRWQEHFSYLSQGSTKYERGDRQILAPLSVSVNVGDTVTIASDVWVVLSRVSEPEYLSLHVRRS